MASKNSNMSTDAPEMQMQQLKESKKQFKQEQNQRKEAKKKAKELESQERELDEQIDGSSASVVIVTLFIILIWLGILVLLVKMDVGGFGSNVLTPILKDVPVINKILPSESTTETTKNEEAYGGYNSLKDAVEQIKTLEKQLDQAQSTNATYAEQIDTLKTEVQRLKTFEDNQVEFQKIKEQFYEEVVYAENGPGADEYRQYYEEMDPTTAEALYKQVIQTEAADKQMQEYANTFSNMQASEAAAILGNMTDNLDLAASILKNLDVSTRGAILGAMDSAIAARIVKIMDPNS